MTWLFLMLLLLLPGCSQWVAEQRAADYAACADIRDAYPDWDAATRQGFMVRCLAVQPGGGARAYSGYYSGMGSSAYGPYGVRGPDWNQFNAQFQSPPPVSPIVILPTSPHSPPTILLPTR